MDRMPKTTMNSSALFYFERSRLNDLFMEAMKYPLVLICAGTGYGKTSAVHDFVQKNHVDTAWVQLSIRDNLGTRFWENYTYTLAQLNKPLARDIKKLGFPNNIDKLNQYMSLMHNHTEMKQQIIVLDDFHLIEDPSVIRFVEYILVHMPPVISVFLVSRSTPSINIARLVSNGQIFNVNEDDLRFSESELAQYFRRLDIHLQPDSLRGIMQDTEGWAFAINLIARSYRRAPAYEGYLRSAMKANIFRLMESEIWNDTSGRLQNFFARLSLIGHLSIDLIALLAGDDKELISEMEKQSTYVRRDSYINAYLIHPLFLEFVSTKQNLLTEGQKRETYAIAGEWCKKNGFQIDALSYYEKIGDYKAIIGVFIGSQPQIPYDIAHYTAALLERAPPEAFDDNYFLVVMHMRSIMSQGLWKDAVRLAKYYEARYINLPDEDAFKSLRLSSIYYCWAICRMLMCLSEDVYDFDVYYKKLDECVHTPINPKKEINQNPGGSWICIMSASRKGAPDEYIAALKRSTAYLTHSYTNFESGRVELASAELLFYRGDTGAAESYIALGLDIAREKKKFGFAHRALFYKLRIAFFQGNYAYVEQALKDLKINADEPEYTNRFADYDITMCWYYCALGLPEKVPDWMKDNFSPYASAGFIENYINQMKARYFYQTRNYAPLHSYIREMKQRESYLFGRAEMLAMEACSYYKMKDKEKARAVLTEAYETASPNDIIMPFIELGKDMRTLTTFMLREPGASIPKSWLANINHKAATYAKHQGNIIAEYRQASGMADRISFSPREREILTDLSRGLTRSEISSGRGLSINTVKRVINSIYSKLGAENNADAIRIAAERKII